MTRRRKARCQDVRGRAAGVQVDRVLVAGNGVNAVFPIDDVVNNDLVITASFGYTPGARAEVTGLLSSGQLRLAPLITPRSPLHAYADAYATLRHGTGPRGKVLIEVNAP